MTIAYCILTYNNSDVLLNASINYFEYFKELGIDVYIYDSSSDTKTYSLYEAWKLKGLDNIYYVDCRHISTADEKYWQIMQGYGLDKEYDFIWPNKDRIYISRSYAEEIIEALSKNPDVIISAKKNDTFIYGIPDMKESYNDPVEFFKYYGATSTSWNAVIFNRNSMLNNIDWEQYDKKYSINKDNPFNQTCLLFVQLSMLENCRIKVVRPKMNDRKVAASDGSGWVKDTVSLWGIRWPAAIRSLPSIYDEHKAYVIKSECMYPIVFGSVDHLIYLADNNWFNKELFSQIEEDFTNLSDIPHRQIEYIFQKDYKKLFNEILDEFQKAFNEHNYF